MGKKAEKSGRNPAEKKVKTSAETDRFSADTTECDRVRDMIVPFIEDRLSVEELEEFLDHMETCSECREDYDMFYTVITGMKLLEKDDYDSDRASGQNVDSETKLESARDYLMKYKALHVEKTILMIMLCITFVFMR